MAMQGNLKITNLKTTMKNVKTLLEKIKVLKTNIIDPSYQQIFNLSKEESGGEFTNLKMAVIS